MSARPPRNIFSHLCRKRSICIILCAVFAPAGCEILAQGLDSEPKSNSSLSAATLSSGFDTTLHVELLPRLCLPRAEDKRRDQINLGRELEQKEEYDSALAAYLRALESDNADVRRDALVAVESLLKTKHSLKTRTATVVEKWGGTVGSWFFTIAALILLALIFRLIGRLRGQRMVRVRSMTGEATPFSEALRASLDVSAQDIFARLAELGPVASSPITFWRLPDLVQVVTDFPKVADVETGRMVAALIGLLRVLRRVPFPLAEPRVSRARSSNDLKRTPPFTHVELQHSPPRREFRSCCMMRWISRLIVMTVAAKLVNRYLGSRQPQRRSRG
jgi:hypothetical protein